MSSETPVVSKENTDVSKEDRRLENAGSTPLPSKEDSPDKEGDAKVDDSAKQDAPATAETETSKEPSGAEKPAEDGAMLSVAPPTTEEGTQQSFIINNSNISREALSQQQSQLPLSLNKLAIFASSQNKLPVSKVKGIVLRLGRHTESSSQKAGRWYKNDNYVDKDSYTWRNMPLFEDHQTHLWTSEGTVRGSCKK